MIEEVVWTIPLPLTAEEALATLGDTVNLLSGSSSVPGVASIDSTFLINGILQTDILAQGVGVHVFCEPMSFSTIGNAFAGARHDGRASAVAGRVHGERHLQRCARWQFAGDAPTADTPPSPAVFEFGADVWRAGWNFINAYQFQWKTSQRELVLNELAADVSYFGAFADAEAAARARCPSSSSSLRSTRLYRSKGSATIFLPVNFRRVGSVNSSERDEQRRRVPPDARLRSRAGHVGRSPVPGLRLPRADVPPDREPVLPRARHPDRDAVRRAGRRPPGAHARGGHASTTSPSASNISPGRELLVHDARTARAGHGVPTAAPSPPARTTSCWSRRSTRRRCSSQQRSTSSREVFKGGILKIGIKIKGWEMPGGWKAYCAQRALPQIIGKTAAG